MYTLFWSTLMFPPFVIFLLNNLCLGKCNCVALCLAWRRGSHFQLASESAGLSCKVAGFATVQLSAQHVPHRNHREMAGDYQDFLFRLHVTADWFSSICLLWSRNSFGRKEKRWLSLQSTKQLLGALSLLSLLLHLTELGKGKQGMPYVRKD